MDAVTIESLEERLDKLEQKIELQDQVTADLVTQSEAMRSLMIKLIEEYSGAGDLLFDINFSILKQDLGAEDKINIGLFLMKVTKDCAAGLPKPSLNEFHYRLLQTMNVSDEDKGDFSLEISKRLLANCVKDSQGDQRDVASEVFSN
ncbi:hypothetical protein [Periweissella fabalis]|uniref:Uncharacterized protein n=1 Tax=Periweissella fabalis TaxID=1070421 RepID=A0A7X6N2D1_9LACO|nr:hypothetical protein [Periweissella fabalis]MCM0599761.1 hypothetical protein [Periweissella fabalis]NKZ24433.1 hypothetical protein [Periweissella fabalis]